MTTEVHELSTHEIEEVEEDEDDDIYNLYAPTDKRLQSLRRHSMDTDIFQEHLRKLVTMYNLSPISRIRNFLEILVKVDEDWMNIHNKILIVRSMISAHHTLGYELLKYLVDSEKILSTDISPSVLLDNLIVHTRESKDSTGLFKLLIYAVGLQDSVPESWRVKNVLSLGNHLDIEYMLNGCILITKENFYQRHKLLACQAILVHNDRYVIQAQDLLMKWMNDSTLSENERADACDVILSHCGDDELKLYAKQTLRGLGRVDQARTIYDNSQNVHESKIEESVKQAIAYLESTKEGLEFKSFESIYNDILDIVTDDDRDDIIISLERIEMDQTVHFERVTLKSLLQNVYARILISEYRDDMKKRLIEELKDTSGTCSTGYFSRLVNVLMGYDSNIQISIGWDTQISANLFGRLNKKIQEREDCDVLLEQLLNKTTNRKEFNQFFISVLPQIREDLYQEFKDYLSDMEWEEHMRNAIITYLIN